MGLKKISQGWNKKSIFQYGIYSNLVKNNVHSDYRLDKSALPIPQQKKWNSLTFIGKYSKAYNLSKNWSFGYLISGNATKRSGFNSYLLKKTTNENIKLKVNLSKRINNKIYLGVDLLYALNRPFDNNQIFFEQLCFYLKKN